MSDRKPRSSLSKTEVNPHALIKNDHFGSGLIFQFFRQKINNHYNIPAYPDSSLLKPSIYGEEQRSHLRGRLNICDKWKEPVCQDPPTAEKVNRTIVSVKVNIYIVTFLLSSATSDKNTGLNIKAGDFAKQARRSGLFPDIQAVSAGAISKARAKVPWEAFQNVKKQNCSCHTFPMMVLFFLTEVIQAMNLS